MNPLVSPEIVKKYIVLFVVLPIRTLTLTFGCFETIIGCWLLPHILKLYGLKLVQSLHTQIGPDFRHYPHTLRHS